jgi:hypothetical protein
MTAKDVQTQLKKLWLKLLKAEAKRNIRKATKLESKIIALELELHDDR